MENQFINVDSDSKDKESVIVFPQTKSMFKLYELMEAVKQSFQHKGLDDIRHRLSHRGGLPSWDEFKNSWVKDGVECEILKVNGKGWQRGKLRIKFTLEFCPDEAEIEEAESPLDDIRRKINEVST